MAGLNFQTQTIINSNVDPDSKKKELFKGESEHLKIRRDFDFYKDKPGYGRIVSVIKAEHTAPELCKVEIDIKKTGQGLLDVIKEIPKDQNAVYCRLDLYLGVEGAEPYIYSAPWVQKGIPFWIEFSIDSKDIADASAGNILTDKLVNIVNKNHIFQCDKDLLTVKNESGKLVIEGTQDYQRIRKIEISTFNAYQDDAVKIAEMANKTESNSSDMIRMKVRGKAGFGTYSHIIKDLRLPTAANWQPTHIRQVETPIIGADYDQFIIEYAAPATNQGLACVGQKLESTTTHVFWVKSDVTKAFEQALTSAGITPLPYPSSSPEVASVSELSDKPSTKKA